MQSKCSADDSGRQRVVVIDDSPAWGEALAHLVRSELGEDARWRAPGDVSPGDVADAAVVVLGQGDDIDDVIALGASIRDRSPHVKLIVLSGPGPRTLDAQADAVLSRDVPGDLFVQVVRSLLDGAVVGVQHDAPMPVRHLGGPRLTRAEARVLRHVAAGYSNNEIAGSLGISTNTVRTHVQRVTGKLGADSRLRAVAMARESGVLDFPPRPSISP